MSRFQFYAKHGIGQRLNHSPLDLNRLFLRHQRPAFSGDSSAVKLVRTSTPSSVSATVCSKCAERELSHVTAVQRSSRIITSGPPALAIGSMARTNPGLSIGPWAGGPKFGI